MVITCACWMPSGVEVAGQAPRQLLLAGYPADTGHEVHTPDGLQLWGGPEWKTNDFRSWQVSSDDSWCPSLLRFRPDPCNLEFPTCNTSGSAAVRARAQQSMLNVPVTADRRTISAMGSAPGIAPRVPYLAITQACGTPAARWRPCVVAGDLVFWVLG